MLVYVKVKKPNRYAVKIISWLIVIEGLSNILMAVLPQFNFPIEALLFNYVSFFELQKITNVMVVFIGMAFMILGRGLFKHQRSSMRITFVLLLFTLFNSVFPSLFLPTFIYTLIMLLLLFIFRKAFYVKTPSSLGPHQWVALTAVLLVMVYGVVGTYYLRAQYHGLNDWLDALYYSLVTYTTIGYGDIYPVTQNAKIFTCSMIIMGVSTFLGALTIVFGPMFEKRLKGVFNMVSRLNNMEGHVIIFGVNAMSLHTAKLLAKKGEKIVFLDHDPAMLNDAENEGFKVIVGAASKEDTLLKAQLPEANAIVCGSISDADNLLVLMAANAVRIKNKGAFRIIVRIDEPEHIPFAQAIGADEVISPSMLMGDCITKDLV